MRLEVKSNPMCIPERLREIDAALRVLFNTDTQEFEVWGLDKSGPYLLASFSDLDGRMLHAVRYGYWLARNTGAPYTALLRKQVYEDYEAEQTRQRELRDLEIALKEDMRGLFRKLWPGWRAA